MTKEQTETWSAAGAGKRQAVVAYRDGDLDRVVASGCNREDAAVIVADHINGDARRETCAAIEEALELALALGGANGLKLRALLRKALTACR